VDNTPFEARTDLTPAAYLSHIGAVFVTFDARTQDSGNISYGVEANGRRWFVKTAGDPADPTPFLPHDQRVALLRNAQRLALSVADTAALPALQGVTESAWGPMLVYGWAPGELVGTPAARRADPESPLQRFRRLPPDLLTAAIDTILDVHLKLCAAGWVACDFYDGSVIYDFAAQRTWLIDLDSYRQGAFTNDMGRMFGSTRFMAPEEFQRGARIDERTTVFTLGRAISVFLGDGELNRPGFRGSEAQYAAMTTACRYGPADRFQSVAELARAWRS
jgi:serine/threonine protein kinase, bacterial